MNNSSIYKMALEMLEPVEEGIFSKTPKHVNQVCVKEITKILKKLLSASKNEYKKLSIKGDVTEKTVADFYSRKDRLTIEFTAKHIHPQKILNIILANGYENQEFVELQGVNALDFLKRAGDSYVDLHVLNWYSNGDSTLQFRIEEGSK